LDIRWGGETRWAMGCYGIPIFSLMCLHRSFPQYTVHLWTKWQGLLIAKRGWLAPIIRRNGA